MGVKCCSSLFVVVSFVKVRQVCGDGEVVPKLRHNYGSLVSGRAGGTVSDWAAYLGGFIATTQESHYAFC